MSSPTGDDNRKDGSMNTKRFALSTMIALAAITFAAPAAQANVTLTDPDGTKLEEGAKVTLTSTNLVAAFEGGATLHCGKVTLHFELLATGPTHLELKQLGEATTEGCTFQSGATNLPATFDDFTAGAGVGENGIVTINTWGTANTHVTFRSTLFSDPGTHLNLISSCHFTTTEADGKAHIVTTGTSGATDTLSLTPTTFTRTPGEEATCSASGMVFTGDFTTETSDGTKVTIDYVKTG
jgi:hypothetical protein